MNFYFLLRSNTASNFIEWVLIGFQVSIGSEFGSQLLTHHNATITKSIDIANIFHCLVPPQGQIIKF